MRSNQDVITFWLDAAGKYPLLPKEEIIRLGNLIQDQSTTQAARQKAVSKLVRHNLRLIPRSVHAVSANKRTFYFGGTNTEDLLQAAVIGLNRAAEKFDPKTGYAFSTYANMWIFQAIQREICNTMSNIKVPENTIRELYKSLNAKEGAFAFSSKTQSQKDRLTSAWKAIQVTSIDGLCRDSRSNSDSHWHYESLNGINHEVRYDDDVTAYHEIVSKAPLSKRQREILYLKFVEDRSPAAIALELGVCVDTVKRNLSLGLRALETVVTR